MNKELLERLENLPLTQAASSDINVFLREVFTEFEILVAANGKKNKATSQFIHWHDKNLLYVQNACKSILEAIEAFLNGKAGRAFEALRGGIEFDGSVKKALKINVIEKV